MSLNNLSVRLGELGRREEALAAIHEATTLYRRLADQHPDAYLPDLAGSLNNLSNRLGELGRHDEAAQVAEESARVREAIRARTGDSMDGETQAAPMSEQ